MAAQPQVFTNASKATALANAQAATAFPASQWVVRATWNSEGDYRSGYAGYGERWEAPFFGARIDLTVAPGGANWTASLYPGS